MEADGESHQRVAFLTELRPLQPAHYPSPPPRNSYNRTTQYILQAHFQNLFSGSNQVSRLHDLERFESGGEAHVDMSSACVV